MSGTGTSNLFIYSPSRELGENFLSSQIFEENGKEYLTLGGTDASRIIGEIDYLDDDSKANDFQWSITYQGEFARVEQLVDLSQDYPQLEFWVQIWDFDNLTPGEVFPDITFSKGVVTGRNIGDTAFAD